MNKYKIFKQLVLSLVIIIISLISFIGLKITSEGVVKNLFLDYKLGNNLVGHRKVVFEIKDEEDVTKTQNGEQTVIEQNFKAERNITNFIKAKEIIRNRLKTLKVSDFNVSVDEYTGRIDLNIEDNEITDVILSELFQKGKFTIEDSQTANVLLKNENIADVKLITQNENIYLSIEFNLEGKKILKEVSKNYKTVENTVGSGLIVSNSLDANQAIKEQVKKVNIKVDGKTLHTTDFPEVIENGKITLKIGSDDKISALSEKVAGANNLVSILKNDVLPFEYKPVTNYFVASSITNEIICKILTTIAVMAVILVVLITIKIKGTIFDFIKQLINMVGYIAILLIALRMANVIIGLEIIQGIFMPIVMIAIYNKLFLSELSKNELNKKDVNKFLNKITWTFTKILVPVGIISLVGVLFEKLAPSGFTNFAAFLFWSVIIFICYNLIVSKIYLNIIAKDKGKDFKDEEK